MVLGTGYTLTHPAEAAVSVINATRPTQCAEEDNVYVKLQGEGLRKLRVEARQPSYMSTIRADSYAPDFTNCKFDENAHPSDPKYSFAPKRVRLWETDKYLMVGNTYASFWRPNKVDFVVSGAVTHEVHLVQLYLKDKTEPKLGGHQFLVLYPPDGYWRAKPIPTLRLNYGVYGTSFLVGPVEEAARPVVEITRVEFVPETLTFKLAYADGSHGELRIAEVDRDRVALDYAHDRALPALKPLAAIRSMYVQPEKSDTAEVSWRTAGEQAHLVEPLPEFSRARAAEVNFGRSVLSRHNASAPDMWFGEFSR
jgi:hypothetical protein